MRQLSPVLLLTPPFIVPLRCEDELKKLLLLLFHLSLAIFQNVPCVYSHPISTQIVVVLPGAPVAAVVDVVP